MTIANDNKCSNNCIRSEECLLPWPQRTRGSTQKHRVRLSGICCPAKGTEQFLHREGSWETPVPTPLGAREQAGRQKIADAVSLQPPLQHPTRRLPSHSPGPGPAREYMDIKYKSQSTTVPAVSISRTVTDKNKTRSEKKLVKY